MGEIVGKNWFKSLAKDTSTRKAKSGTQIHSPKDLLESIKAYRDERGPFDSSKRDSFPTNSYPKSISHWPGMQGIPQGPGKDLVLSFLAVEYPDIVDKWVSELALAWSPDQICGTSELEKLLVLENLRRNTGSARPDQKPFWTATADRIKEKYEGNYLLFRINSQSKVTVEPFCMACNPHKPQLLSIFWACGGEDWVGDLYVNSFKFGGIASRRSGNKVLEPVSFSVLRSSTTRPSPPNHSGLILPGVITGWVDGTESELAVERTVLAKVGSVKPLQILSYSDFLDFKTIFKGTAFDAIVALENWMHHPKICGYLGAEIKKIDKLKVAKAFSFPLPQEFFPDINR